MKSFDVYVGFFSVKLFFNTKIKAYGPMILNLVNFQIGKNEPHGIHQQHAFEDQGPR